MELFAKIVDGFSAVIYFRKKLHLRCLTGSRALINSFPRCFFISLFSHEAVHKKRKKKVASKIFEKKELLAILRCNCWLFWSDFIKKQVFLKWFFNWFTCISRTSLTANLEYFEETVCRKSFWFQGVLPFQFWFAFANASHTFEKHCIC